MSYSEEKSERVPVTAPDEPPRERTGLSAGRIVNGVILLVHVAMFITALCTIGLVASVMNQIAAVRPVDVPATELGTCPFYGQQATNSTGTNYLQLSHNGVCLWFISVHVILAIAAIVFFLVGLVRIVFAMDIGLGTVIELIALPILFILAFADAVSISIGIPVTCDNIIDRTADCSDVGFPSGKKGCGASSDVCWYGYAKSAEAAAWIIHIFLVVYFVINIARLVIFIRRRKEEQRRRQLVDYDTSEDPPPAPV